MKKLIFAAFVLLAATADLRAQQVWGDPTQAIPPSTASAAVASSYVACSAGCNAFGGVAVNTDTNPVWIMAFNATAAPADGAVTPAWWVQIPASSTAELKLSYGDQPTRWTTGLTFVCSSTGPFTKTAAVKCAFNFVKG